MTEELKVCPFCGQEVTLQSSSQMYAFIISHKGPRNCPFFRFEISWNTAKSLKEAKELWNRRVEVNNGDIQ